MALTRSLFKKKVLSIGLLSFVAISTASIGFATWVVSTDGKGELPGNVEIGTVTDGNIEITELAFVEGKNKFSFNPLEGDNSGRVRVKDDGEVEALTVKFFAKITPADYVGKINVKLESNANFTNAAEKNYLVLPAEMNETGKQLVSGTDYVASGTEITLNYEISFKWGSAFGGKNPSYYYDEVETGMAVEDSVVKTTLEEFRTTLLGSNSEPLSFTITVTAEAN